MGIKNPEVLYTSGCRAIVEGEFCGKPLDAAIHEIDDGHDYEG